MENFIVRENIRRFRKQLEDCADPEQRNILEYLLDAEYHRRQQTNSESARSAISASTDPVGFLGRSPLPGE